jgi:hypothetical protein
MTTITDNTPADYTPLDFANDTIDGLRSELATSRMDGDPEEKLWAKQMIDDLQKENKTLNAVLQSVKNSRDFIQHELNEVKKQCLMQRRQISKLKAA